MKWGSFMALKYSIVDDDGLTISHPVAISKKEAKCKRHKYII